MTDSELSGLTQLSITLGTLRARTRIMAAQAQDQAPNFLTPDELAAEVAEDQWTTVSEEDVDETKYSFDVLGDEFIGEYLGSRTIDGDNGKLVQFRFARGEHRYFINGNWSLTLAMTNVRKGSVCRIKWVSERDTGKESKLRIFKVDVAKRGVKAPTHPA